MLKYGAPTILTGDPTPVGSIASGIVAWIPRELDLGSNVLQPASTIVRKRSVTIQIDFSCDDFARLLAKIALGIAIARHGLAGFEEIFVRELILGNAEEANRLVGGYPLLDDVRLSDNDGGSLHGVSEYEIDGFLVVMIQLFRQSLGTPQPPTYQIAVGRLKHD